MSCKYCGGSFATFVTNGVELCIYNPECLDDFMCDPKADHDYQVVFVAEEEDEFGGIE
ncbi:hypothetical protein [Baia soyae]|uniref:Uncharacterized protein n=1 Tax=Baia soyae TaxID=1544746 RepID=A0A4R2RCV9_9BACL|nr:hypothetical protein [Baia soyae]TCP61242.1 hypothetical protein EDD57_1648 [Baia soyae]